MIRQIGKDVVHNITSGQVVVDLQSIVKELLENCVDAGAKSISISIKSNNSRPEYIEINDNGSGIDPKDFESIALKNYTSKLANFDELTNVLTLGFRGEALNAISSMAQLEIKTATEGLAPSGWYLKYDSNGELIQKEATRHPKGTTIKISKLFRNLPVRKLNLHKNFKRELQRMLNCVLQYLIILTDLRIMVYHLENNKTKKILLKSNGNKLVKDNIINVFGSTGLQGVEEFKGQIYYDSNDASKVIGVSGLISNSSFGNGRSSKDRQFVYINKRPVDWKPVLKLANEIYKKFNYLQLPLLVLDFTIGSNILDINVTPDKSIVLLDHSIEQSLLAELGVLLEQSWNQQDNYVIPVNKSADNILKGRISQRQLDLDSYISSYGSAVVYENTKKEKNAQVFEEESIKKEGSQNIDLKDSDHDEEPEINVDRNLAVSDSVLSEQPDYNFQAELQEELILSQLSAESSQLPTSHNCNEVDSRIQFSKEQEIEMQETSAAVNTGIRDEQSELKDVQTPSAALNDASLASVTFSPKPVTSFDSGRIEQTIIYQLPSSALQLPKTINHNTYTSTVTPIDILNNDECERQLTLNVHKKDFMDMEIIGQFNKGFILVRNPKTQDIFIVDQHASDEKYNFERLSNETVINSQRLVIPELLDLNSIDKLTISSHLKTFEKNGFQFKFEHDDESQTDQIFLVSLPYSKSTIFTISDLHELIYLLQERNTTCALSEIVRPSKVRSMFAMRACRSSIMIGQALSHNKMVNVVRNLSDLDKPWNCPHGRPTMRHLVKLKQWDSFNSDYSI